VTDLLTAAASEPVVPVHPEDLDAVAGFIAAAKADSTRRVYASAWRLWVQWADGRGYGSLPADPLHVAAYAAALAGAGRSVSTIDRARAAIAAEHQQAGHLDPTTAEGVRLARSGIRRTIGTAPRRQVHALQTEEVRRLIDVCDTASLRGLRDRALLLLGYAAALRRSDLRVLDVGYIAFRPAGLVVTVRRSKGDQEGEGQVVGVVRGHGDTDPVHAVRAWIRAAGLTDPNVPLLGRVAWSDRRVVQGSRLSGQAVRDIIAQRAEQAGLGDLDIAGHSLRAGHATVASEAGVPAERIARTKRHARLETLAHYVRPAEVLRDSSSGALGL
jgi:site-specific recombinase XerD